ncbi:hypothetical protein CLOM_g4467 [Closterium sp. NIES-68]|nr:hypothetical protein CLOM_g4467 [Closterium sp. NIES-68]
MDDPQFMMFAINGGLLTLLGKALNSTEKVTFFVPNPDTIKDLPSTSPLINDPDIATAVVNFHVVRGRQVTYTDLTQDGTGTLYPTDQHEPLVKDAASFLFQVVLRPTKGPSRATITMPNAYTDEYMQVHVLDSLLIPDSVYFSPPAAPVPAEKQPPPVAAPIPPPSSTPNTTLPSPTLASTPYLSPPLPAPSKSSLASATDPPVLPPPSSKSSPPDPM